MNNLVKLFIDEYGDNEERQDWHLEVFEAGSPQTFCGGQVFGYGEGVVGTNFERKETARGGITCKGCLRRIHEIKAVRL